MVRVYSPFLPNSPSCSKLRTMKFSFKSIFLLSLSSLLLACSSPAQESEETEMVVEAPKELKWAVTDLPFCEVENYVLLDRIFQGQTQDFTYYSICVSEQKVEFKLGTVSAGVLVAYHHQQYYLPELSFEDFLTQVEAIGLTDTQEDQDYSSFGTCHAWDTLIIQQDASQEFRRGAPCGREGEVPWITSVQGDFDEVVELMKTHVPDLDSLLEIATEIYWQ
jgi:hypothetical protein